MNKKIPLLAVIALLSYLLTNADKCAFPKDTIKNVLQRDTVYMPFPQPDTITKVVVKYRTVTDTVHLERVQFVEKDTAYIFFADEDTDRETKIWQGSIASEKNTECQYDYTIGVYRDTVQFLTMESTCTRPDTIVESTVLYRPVPAPFRKSLSAGAYWSITDPLHTRGISLQSQLTPRIYVGANYGPFEKQFFVTAGYRLFPR